MTVAPRMHKPASFTPVHSGLLQRKCACGGTPGLDGECEQCQRKRLQRYSSSSITQLSAPPIVHEVLHSPGQPMDTGVRSLMENRFSALAGSISQVPSVSQHQALAIGPSGDHFEREAERVEQAVTSSDRADARPISMPGAHFDFSRVRIHIGASAAESARAVGAHAYTVGNEIVFGAGEYAPSTVTGRHVLAHELTHTLQQMTGGRGSLIQRMETCPAGLTDDQPVPKGWKPYYGNPCVFHCCYRGILEDRRPSPTDPQNECFYDHSGTLVDEHHPYAGCRGTPDQFDAETNKWDHTFKDSGGIWQQGWGAFTSSMGHLWAGDDQQQSQATAPHIPPVVGNPTNSTSPEAVTVPEMDVAESGTTLVPVAPRARESGRACGPQAIGNPTGCTGVSGDAAGERFLFNANCSDFRKPPQYRADEEQRLIDFSRTLGPGNTVAIHGFASIEGDAEFNDKLSCARAQAAASVIQSVISSITVLPFYHGAMQGDAALRRSVVIDVNHTLPSINDNQNGATANPAPQERRAMICSKRLDAPGLGEFANHSYIDNTGGNDCRGSSKPGNYAIQQLQSGNFVKGCAVKTDHSDDPQSNPPNMKSCMPKAGVTDVSACLRAAFNAYQNPSEYMSPSGPNSNTFASTLAAACCADASDAGLGWVPGWGQSPAGSCPEPARCEPRSLGFGEYLDEHCIVRPRMGPKL